MTGQEALALIDTLLNSAEQGRRLNDVQSVVFLETWAGHSYREIAQQFGYEHDYIKHVGSHLWRLISQAVGEQVSKHSIQSFVRRYQQSQRHEESSSEVNTSHSTQDWRDANQGWILNEGTLYSTTNGEKSWNAAPSNTLCDALKNYRFAELDFVNSQVGWILLSSPDKNQSHLLETTDGGVTWVTQRV